MTLRELRELATQALGHRLERMTPVTLGDFLASIQDRLPGTQRGGVLVVDGAPGTYEEAMRLYFAGMLSAAPEVAAASLWITAAEMWVDAVRQLTADR
jgi:hypothetical protein